MSELSKAEKLLKRLRDEVLGPELPDASVGGAAEGMQAEIAVAFEEIDKYFKEPRVGDIVRIKSRKDWSWQIGRVHRDSTQVDCVDVWVLEPHRRHGNPEVNGWAHLADVEIVPEAEIKPEWRS